MPNQIINVPENTSALSVNGTIYNFELAPAYADPLVIEQKNELLQKIDLNELTDNLYLSVELLFVAYNGVAGAQEGKLQAEINDLSGALALLCNKCITTMMDFQTETKNIVTELGQTYRWLMKGSETMAIAKLKRCGESSGKMATKANELSTGFEQLQLRSVKVRSSAIMEEASEYNKELAAEKAIREMESKQKTEKVNQEELVAQVANTQMLYDDAKAREEKAADKAFIMGITSAITGAIGAGLGAFVAVKNPVRTVLTKISSAEEDKKMELAQKAADDKKALSDTANKELLKVDNKLIPARSKLTALKKEETELTTQISILEGVKKDTRTDKQKEDLAAFKTKLADKTKAIAVADDEMKALGNQSTKLKQSAKDLTAEYGAAAVALQTLAGSLDKMAAAAASAEDSIRLEKMKFLEKKFGLEAEKRKSLVAMAEFAENIKNATVEQGNAEVTVNSLHAAVEALGKIIGTLTNASLFWRQMAAFCTNMLEQGFQAKLKDLNDPSNGVPKEVRLEEYQDKNFMMSFLTYMCQWVALNGLSGEYLVSASNAQKKCLANIAQSPTIEAAKRDAPLLAKAMGIMLNQKILASNSASSDILQQQARLATK